MEVVGSTTESQVVAPLNKPTSVETSRPSSMLSSNRCIFKRSDRRLVTNCVYGVLFMGVVGSTTESRVAAPLNKSTSVETSRPLSMLSSNRCVFKVSDRRLVTNRVNEVLFTRKGSV